MSGRLDYYFRQPVTEAELDRGFDLLEQADRAIVVDLGLTGISLGLGVGENGVPDLNVQVASGVAYSKDGERILLPSTQLVDISEDDAAASTAVVGAANEKWVSVFAIYDRVLSDPRIDGNALTVFFERAESFGISVVQGAEAALGTSTRPALDATKILLSETLLVFGQTAVTNGDLDVTRRETLTLPLSSSLYGGGPNWADGETNPSVSVEAQLDKIISDLGQDADGANRILAAAIAGAPFALSQASIAGQTAQHLAHLNSHVNSSSAHTPGNVGAVASQSNSLFGAGADVAQGIAPGVRAINPQTQVVAWATIGVVGTTITILESYNFTTPALVGVGDTIDLSLLQAVGSNSSVFVTESGVFGTMAGMWMAHMNTTTQLLVRFRDFSGVSASLPGSARIHVSVLGRPA